MSNGEQQAQPGADTTDAITDVGAQRVARVYAEALLNSAEKRGEADALLEQFDSLVRDVFPANPLIEEFLATPAVPAKVKAASIESTFGPRAGELFTNFLLVLNDHGRLGLLREILAQLRDLHDRRARRMRVQIRSAVPLYDDQRERLRHGLREAFHQEPILEEHVDPELLGGLVVRVGDRQFDGSVRTELQTIRTFLIERSSHEIQSGRDRFGIAE
jgi:F-type H+-transporting ATPase subunit delta